MTTKHTPIKQSQDTDMTTILVTKEIDDKTDREIHATLGCFLTNRSDVGAFRYERQRIVIHYIPGATMGYLIDGDDNGRAVLERFCDMGLIEIEWDRVYTVLGQDEPVVWLKEAGLIYLAEKEAKKNEASKPIDLDSLPF